MFDLNLWLNINKALPLYIIILSALESIIFVDIRGFLFFIGAFGCEVLNIILKYNIFKPFYHMFGRFKNGGYYLPLLGRGDRPLGAKHCNWFDNCGECKNDLPLNSFGMPSGHSQFIMYSSTFLIAYLYFKYFKTKKYSLIKSYFYPIVTFIAVLSICAVYTRITLKCHTIQHVLLGGMIGIKIGLLYFLTVKNFFIQ